MVYLPIYNISGDFHKQIIGHADDPRMNKPPCNPTHPQEVRPGIRVAHLKWKFERGIPFQMGRVLKWPDSLHLSRPALGSQNQVTAHDSNVCIRYVFQANRSFSCKIPSSSDGAYLG